MTRAAWVCPWHHLPVFGSVAVPDGGSGSPRQNCQDRGRRLQSPEGSSWRGWESSEKSPKAGQSHGSGCQQAVPALAGGVGFAPAPWAALSSCSFQAAWCILPSRVLLVLTSQKGIQVSCFSAGWAGEIVTLGGRARVVGSGGTGRVLLHTERAADTSQRPPMAAHESEAVREAPPLPWASPCCFLSPDVRVRWLHHGVLARAGRHRASSGYLPRQKELSGPSACSPSPDLWASCSSSWSLLAWTPHQGSRQDSPMQQLSRRVWRTSQHHPDSSVLAPWGCWKGAWQGPSTAAMEPRWVPRCLVPWDMTSSWFPSSAGGVCSGDRCGCRALRLRG